MDKIPVTINRNSSTPLLTESISDMSAATVKRRRADIGQDS